MKTAVPTCSCLPVVNTDTAQPLIKALTEGDNTYFVESLLKLQESNPAVANFISHFAMSLKNPLEAATCGLIVYQLLEKQAESNTLATKLG